MYVTFKILLYSYGTFLLISISVLFQVSLTKIVPVNFLSEDVLIFGSVFILLNKKWLDFYLISIFFLCVTGNKIRLLYYPQTHSHYIHFVRMCSLLNNKWYSGARQWIPIETQGLITSITGIILCTGKYSMIADISPLLIRDIKFHPT